MPHRTPLYSFHIDSGARMVDFAGWEMPLAYGSIIEEHNHTRTSAGVFDVSHMGRLNFDGPDAGRLLDHLVSRKLEDLPVGRSRYGLVCNEAGGVMDDVIVAHEETRWSMVCNAGNREKLLPHFADERDKLKLDCTITDKTFDTAMLALQGPKVMDKLAETFGEEVTQLKRFGFLTTSYMMMKFTFYRSGYTGEDGVEVVMSAKAAKLVIKAIGGNMQREEATFKPAGLGARDTLRIEAALPLYGHELNEETDPLTSGLGWAVNLDKPFVGRDAVLKVREAGQKYRLIGLVLEGKRQARQGQPVTFNGEGVVGHVTSGTLSPTLGKSIAMALVETPHTNEGQTLSVDFKGKTVNAEVVKLPFYKRP
ncbi:MAG: glycine cleavage system aminomethyltransferase GcvT [Phycisphaerae bacterium]